MRSRRRRLGALTLTPLLALAMAAGALTAPAAASPPGGHDPGQGAAQSSAQASEQGRWQGGGPGSARERSWPTPGLGLLRGTLTLDGAGQLALTVTQGWSTVVTAQTLGLVTADADLTRDLRFVDRDVRLVHDRYSMTTGKRLDRVHLAIESTFTFRGATGALVQVVVRVAPDGVAYRYVLPDDAAHTVSSESGRWTFPRDGAVWNQDGYAVNYEADWAERTLSGNLAGDIGFPVLAETAGRYALLTEADVDGRYSGSHLTHEAGSLSYGLELFESTPVTHDGPLATPWRVAIVGDLATVVESTLVDDLAPPSRLADTDTSWIRPGVSSWSWMTDWGSPRDEARQRDFVDLSARNGWEYVLLDEGWSAEWVPRTTRYANARGVDTIVWFHSRDLQTQEQRDHWLPLLREWGVAGLKIDFMDTDSQEIHQWYDAVLADTARHQLMVNFHGSTLPHGLQRTWPHLMSYEAVRGAENGISPSRSLTVPFARGVLGSMDWTPVTFSRGSGASSKAHELAMAVVYESGWQHMSDKPEAYAAEPVAEGLLQNLPTTWDRTELLSGDPGGHVVQARRSGDTWFVGGMRAGSGPALDVPLRFLGAGRWLVHTITDAPGADGAPDGSVLATQVTTRRAHETLRLPTATNGGFVVVACPAQGRTTCFTPVEPTATLDVTADPDVAELEVGDTLEVTARAVVTSGDGTDVSFGPRLPAGWTMTGAAVERDRLATGDVLEGTWTLTVGPDAVRGDLEVAVGAAFTSGGREVFAADGIEVFVAPDAPDGQAWVSDLPWLEDTAGWASNRRDLSNSGGPLSVRGEVFAKGVGTHAPSAVTVWAGGRCTAFRAVVGTDDGAGTPAESSVSFQVLGDGRLLAETPVLRATSEPVELVVDVAGVDRLTLRTTDGGDGKNNDHADWGDASVWCGDAQGPTPPTEPAGLTGSPYVSDLEWTGEANGYGPVERDQSNGEAARGDGNPLTIAGQVFDKGVGMHATGQLTTWLGRTCTTFEAVVGIDDEVTQEGSVSFQVLGDGMLLADTGVVTSASGGVPLSVDVTGVRSLTLIAHEATNGKNFDHADWGGAQLVCAAA
ncbi:MULTISPECIES: NPCBM/NEW2 domain-containing protein [unclassified Actinotalea]|uniref:NPCBM/NEW2 domain-containing protein n=1 Tax=unclassified Actinotalea TaxID=2638618 RepID=UPI002106D51F|nr:MULTISPECIES: NPCBM/NEW2 domain-containing protein [unclassified Actinotalea]